MVEEARPGGDAIDQALMGLIARSGATTEPVAVDVGGGSGTRAVPLALGGCRVIVVDSSADALAILNRRATDGGVGTRVTGVQADAENLGSVVGEGAADLVLCHHLLEEVDDPPAVVRAIAAAVRPGGYVSVVSAGRLGAVLGQAMVGRFGQARAVLTDPAGRYGPADPLRRRYNSEELTRLLTDAGLRVSSVTGVGVLTGLVPGAARQMMPAGDSELIALEAAAALDPALHAIAGHLHVIARRPGTHDGSRY